MWDEIWKRIKDKTPEEPDPGFRPKGTGAGEFAPGQQGARGKGTDIFDDALRRIKGENPQGGRRETPWGRKQPEPGFLKGGTPQEQGRGLQSGGAAPRRTGAIGSTASSAPYFGAAAGGQGNNGDPFLRGGKTQGMRNGRGSYDDDVAELEELFRRAAEDAKKSMKPGSEDKIAEAIWREMNGEAGEVKKDWGESAQNGMEMVYNGGKQKSLGRISESVNALSDIKPGKIGKEKNRGYADAPKELKQIYDLLGEGNTEDGVSFEKLQKAYGRSLEFQMDDQGNVVGDYRNAFSEKIDQLYPEMNDAEKETLLDGSMLLLKAEYAKTQADPEKVIDVTDRYQEMVSGSLNNLFWPFEMLGIGPWKGQYYLKNDPQKIKDICGDQIPDDIMDEAIRIGGADGVRYMQEQGYGLFRVGDKIMSPEELGNYSLGVIATATGNSRGLGYFAADADKMKMGTSSDAGELYDKYFQTMGMNDVDLWDHRR